MAVNLLDLAKAYLNDTFVKKASDLLGESEQNTQVALTGTLPTMLGGIIQKASEPGGPGTLLDLIGQLTTPNRATGELTASESGILDQLDNLLSSQPTQASSLLSLGSDIVNNVFGAKANNVADVIARYSGVKTSSASSLMSIASTVLLSLLGKKMADDGSGPVGLTSFLNSQTAYAQSAVPSSLGSLISAIPGLGLLGSLTGNVSRPGSGNYVPPVQATTPPPAPSYQPDERDSGNRWLPWLMLLLGAAALFFILRSCNNDKGSTNETTTDTTSLTTDASAGADTIVNTVEAVVDSSAEELEDLTAKLGAFFKRKLPSGIELNIPEFGIENNLVKFIEDPNKPVDKTTWFNFDRLLFDTGKATLKPASQEQLKNMAEILKAYPQVELKLGGYTDNTGSADVNKKLSQDRADSVKRELVKLGIAASRLDAEGYGQEHPVASNDTAEGRAQNRRIAVRVTKK